MISKIEKKRTVAPENVGSRNAVETAIDLSRLDRQSTWDGLARKMRKAVKPSQSINKQTLQPK